MELGLVHPHVPDGAGHARREADVGVALKLLESAVPGLGVHRLGPLGVRELGGHAADHEELHQGPRGPGVHLPGLPEVSAVGLVANAPCREEQGLLVAVHADPLEATVLLLVVVDALHGLRDRAEARHVAEVVRGEDAVVAGPLRGPGGLLVNDNDGGRLNGHVAAPVHGVGPLHRALDDRGLTRVQGVVHVSHDVKALQLGEGAAVLDELVDGLVLLLVAAVSVGEAQHDHVALDVAGLDGGLEVLHDLLPLRRQGEDRVRVLLKEGVRHVDQLLVKELGRPAVALRRVIAHVVALKDLAHHGVQLLIVHLARVKDLLGRRAVEDVVHGLVVAHLAPELAERLRGARAVVALVQVQHHLEPKSDLLLNPGEAQAEVLLAGDGEDGHVLATKLLALLLVRLAVPGGDEGVLPRGLTHRVAHGDVLHHLTLA